MEDKVLQGLLRYAYVRRFLQNKPMPCGKDLDALCDKMLKHPEVHACCMEYVKETIG